MTGALLRVVITGASSGIGKALAHEYAKRGATLALIARRGDILTRIAGSLPVRSYTYTADVRDARALAEVRARVELARKRSPLFDSARFARAFESLLEHAATDR